MESVVISLIPFTSNLQNAHKNQTHAIVLPFFFCYPITTGRVLAEHQV